MIAGAILVFFIGSVSVRAESVKNETSKPSLAAEYSEQNPAADQGVEMSSLAVSVGQIGFIPIGWRPSETAWTTLTHGVQPTMCQLKVLDALNKRFPRANLTAANIVPPALNARGLAMANVNIHGSEAQLASVSKGRYAPRRFGIFGLLIGYGPSLHIVSRPSFLDPHALRFSKTLFTAHLDSAWAYTPVGAILHFAIDVLRPNSRNPCP